MLQIDLGFPPPFRSALVALPTTFLQNHPGHHPCHPVLTSMLNMKKICQLKTITAHMICKKDKALWLNWSITTRFSHQVNTCAKGLITKLLTNYSRSFGVACAHDCKSCHYHAWPQTERLCAHTCMFSPMAARAQRLWNFHHVHGVKMMAIDMCQSHHCVSKL